VVDAALIVLGLVLLLGGGELVVRGASRLALALGMSPLAVGLTVVAFATSAPELAASLTAAWKGTPEVAVGNVIGSNIANVGLILGAAGLLAEIPVQWSFLRREVVAAIVTALALVAVLFDGEVGRVEGAVLVVALLGWVLWLLRVETARAEPAVVEEFRQEYVVGAAPRQGAATNLLILAVGVALLVGGAQALVSGAVSIALALGVSEAVVGLTVVAIGTSLPELASSLVAAWRGEGDLALGNVVGSNIFNVLGILGATAVLVPISVDPAAFTRDLWVLMGFSIALVPILLAGMRLRRWEGGLLVTAYLVYTASLFLTG
jgi:cation:H+ antiporter